MHDHGSCHTGAAHFLIVGEAADIPTMRELIEKLPVEAYGQVFVEVPSGANIEVWDAPAGVTVTWLRRDGYPGLRLGLMPRGELIAQAAAAWVSEWMPEDEDEHDLPYMMWIGCVSSPAVHHLCHDLNSRLAGR